MQQTYEPRVKAMCVFTQNGNTLASNGYDKNKGEVFYRLIGGSVGFGEKSEEGIKREVREELNCDVDNLELLTVVENIFTFEGKQGHEIVFVYKGDLSNKELYEREKIHVVEPYGEFDAEWISINDVLTNKIKLYPALDYSKILK